MKMIIMIKMMILMSRVDREGEVEVCSERDTHHPVAALAWCPIMIMMVVMMIMMMKRVKIRTKPKKKKNLPSFPTT